MIKFDNLNDSGYLCWRLIFYCTKTDNVITVVVNNDSSIELKENDLLKLYEHIYEYLRKRFSRPSWFEEHSQDYRSTNIGFGVNEQ